MRKTVRLGLLVMAGILAASAAFGQGKQIQTERRPAANVETKTVRSESKAAAVGGAYNILDGLPVLLELHRDTEVGSNKPVDVYVFVIEMQIMNSDGNAEPVGLRIFNFYTAHPQDAKQDVNPHSARDCKTWFALQTKAMQDRNPALDTWPYVEFVTAVGARVLQTNEDGAVYWSDDIECWGSSDRFPPF